MKPVLNSLLCLCLAACLFVSCTKDKPKEQPQPVKNPPGVTEFTLTGTFNEDITITGTNFGTKKELIEVKFGDAKAEVISSTSEKIIVKVPESIKSSKSKITVTVEGLTVVSASEFTLKKPEINKTPEFAKLDSVVTFEVKNFHPQAAQNKIFIGGKEITNAEFLPGSVKFKIPKGSYPDNTATLKFKMLDYEVEKKISVKRDIWKLTGIPIPTSWTPDYFTRHTFVIDNKAYVIAGHDIPDVWMLNKDLLAWEKVGRPTGDNAFYFGEGGLVYNSTHAYLLSWEWDRKFVRYNPKTNEWIFLKDPPVPFTNPAMFIFGNSIFVGLGGEWPIRHFYRYDIGTDTWAAISPYPGKDLDGIPFAFVIGDLAYVGAGSSRKDQDQVFSYNAVTDKWSEVQNFPIETRSGNSFSWAGKGYVWGRNPGDEGYLRDGYSRSVYQFNPTDNKWVKHSMLEEGYLLSLESLFTFILNGKVYVGTTQNGIHVANLDDL